ncbi:MAG: Gfo/Idh/MocA family oxidoreductase [Thermoleophilaceae bacterium]
MSTNPTTSEGSPLRVGIAGYGLAGAVFHAPLIEAVDGLEVAAVMTRSPERAEQARRAHPGARVVDAVDELLDGIDLLVVATPNSTHVPLALAGLDRGAAVVVDKPIAVTSADARRLLDAGGRLTVFQNRRWDGDYLTVKRLLADGELGEVFRFESRFERFRPEVDHEKWRELADAAEGGGLLLDLGTHLVDQAVELFGPPVGVYGELAARRPGAVVEDDVFIALRHEGDVRSHLWMSATAALPGPRFRVLGLRAGFTSQGLDPQEQQLRDGMRPGDPGFGQAPGLEPGRYADFYAGVRDWLRGEAAPPVDPADAVRVLEILETLK